MYSWCYCIFGLYFVDAFSPKNSRFNVRRQCVKCDADGQFLLSDTFQKKYFFHLEASFESITFPEK